MTNPATQEALHVAEIMCKDSGARLTVKRKQALTVLLDSLRPLSAYEVKAEYEARFNESLTAMSAYRMLNFLVDEGLAHKLHSVNKYTACAHISCDHSHDLPQFLICDDCHRVMEISVEKATLQRLKDGLESSGFVLNEEQFEFRGYCSDCQK